VVRREIVEFVRSGKAADFCRRYSVAELSLFGSVARGDDHEKSDVDLLVSFSKTTDSSIDDAMRDEIERLFGRRVDVVRDGWIENPFRRHNILLDKQRLFPVAELGRQTIRDSSHFDRDLACIWDIVEAAQTLVEVTTGKSFEDYLGDKFLRLGCERALILIGQGARGLSDDFRGRHPDVEWGKIIGHRNELVHNYRGIDQEVVWEIISVDVPPLVETLAGLIRNTPH
jgi:uncharacterized protein